MRLKLDENLPDEARQVASLLGHEVDTVADEGLQGASDPEVLRASGEAGRVLVTLDRGFGDVRRHRPGTHQGIVVLRPDSQDSSTVAEALRAFLHQKGLGDLTGCVVVVRRHLVRVRRPS